MIDEREMLRLSAESCKLCAEAGAPTIDDECDWFVHGAPEDPDAPACAQTLAWYVWSRMRGDIP